MTPGAIAAFLGLCDKSQHTEHIIAERWKESGLLMTSPTATLIFLVYKKVNVPATNYLWLTILLQALKTM